MSRRTISTTLVLAVVAVMTLAGILFALRGDAGLVSGGRIAVLDIDGLIADDQEFLEHVRDFRQDRSVKGYVVNINSPGGSVGPAQSIYRELRRVRVEDSVPVIASIGGLGASGGYYIALAADSIFALPGSITGSIGVIMELPDASALMDKVGVRMQTVQSAARKDVGSPFRPLTAEDRSVLDALVMDVYEQFVDVVALERQLDRADVEAVADGRILSGRQALEQRLIDRLGNFEDARSAAGRMAGLGDKPQLVRAPDEWSGLWGVLFGKAGDAVLSRVALPLDAAAGPRIRFVMPW